MPLLLLSTNAHRVNRIDEELTLGSSHEEFPSETPAGVASLLDLVVIKVNLRHPGPFSPSSRSHSVVGRATLGMPKILSGHSSYRVL